MAKAKKFELALVPNEGFRIGRYRRWHATFEEAEACAGDYSERMQMSGDPLDFDRLRAAIIYGPGCGEDGHTVVMS